MTAVGEQSGSGNETWEDVLASLCRFQTILPGAPVAGGTAAALYAKHRFSLTTTMFCPTVTGSIPSLPSSRPLPDGRPPASNDRS